MPVCQCVFACVLIQGMVSYTKKTDEFKQLKMQWKRQTGILELETCKKKKGHNTLKQQEKTFG